MITEGQGSLLASDADALVNTVNTVGVMGKGVALQFKKAFPNNFKEYEKACRNGEVVLGKMFVTYTGMFSPRIIINFPTKGHWKSNARLSDIKAGLSDLIEVVQRENIQRIAVPPLGCGLGGLRWEDVRPLIVSAFSTLPDVEVILYAPGMSKVHHSPVNTPKPPMTNWMAALILLLREYAVLGFEASHLEAQKLVYFLSEANEPLKIRFVKADYGPYDQGMRQALLAMDGHYVRDFGDGRRLDPVSLMEGAVESAEAFLHASPETISRVEEVAALISGFESPYGLELLATVHWVATREGAESDDDIILKAHEWNSRKRMLLKPEHIRVAAEQLRSKGWLGEAEAPTRD